MFLEQNRNYDISRETRNSKHGTRKFESSRKVLLAKGQKVFNKTSFRNKHDKYGCALTFWSKSLLKLGIIVETSRGQRSKPVDWARHCHSFVFLP